jgi:hypothetical protein
VEREDGRRSRNLEGIRRAEILSMNLGGYRGWAGQFEWDFPPAYRAFFPEHGFTIPLTRQQSLKYAKQREDVVLNWDCRLPIPRTVLIEKETSNGWEVIETIPPLTTLEHLQGDSK